MSNLVVRQAFRFGRGHQTFGLCLIADAFEIEASAVVGNLDRNIARFVRGGDLDGSFLGLAERKTFVGRLDPVVGAIAQQMGQGIADEFDELAIKLGIGALGDEVKFLLEIDGEFAHQTRQAGEQAPDRLHAGAHHRVLKIGREAREPLQRRFDGRILVVAGDFQKLVAG